MNEATAFALLYGGFIGFVLCLAAIEAWEWVQDEWIAWRLKRNYKKLYWFINK